MESPSRAASETESAAAHRRSCRSDLGSGPLPSIDVADALLDERRELTKWANNLHRESSRFPI
jgi:hypothetical protein